MGQNLKALGIVELKKPTVSTGIRVSLLSQRIINKAGRLRNRKCRLVSNSVMRSIE